MLDANGDYTFGRGVSEFLVNTPEAVAQAVGTRLKLITGEWFLDTAEGTPYLTNILGTGTGSIYDQTIKARILGTQGVISIDSYSSTLDTNTRALTVNASISTIYGIASITQVI